MTGYYNDYYSARLNKGSNGFVAWNSTNDTVDFYVIKGGAQFKDFQDGKANSYVTNIKDQNYTYSVNITEDDKNAIMASKEYGHPLRELKKRSEKTLAEIDELNHDKDRRIVVCRELTKAFETIYRGLIAEVAAKIKKDPLKGEFIAVLEGKQ